MSELGQIALAGALGLALYAIVASLAGVHLRIRELVASGRNAALGVTVLLTTAAVALLAGFLTHDYSMRYVYEHANRDMPPDLIPTAFYSGQQGSLLYWSWTLSLLTAFVLWQNRGQGPHRVYMPYVVAVLMGVQVFMALLLGFVATPFERLPFRPADGVGLNPLLYDDGMKIHPPMLLAGYMSWSVPFAFAIAALATGKLDNVWVGLVRRYALFAWIVLGLGNLLGAWWAYRVLGWGGFWGWDPVENVAIMPWLTGTAFIHSIQIQERRGMLKAWNVALMLITFLLSIFGTFVVRSGVLSSVHSFALSSIGPYFLGYFALVVVGSFALFVWRLPRLRADNALESLLSREASFLLNNLLFLGVTFAIFWGTVYPLISEALGGVKVTVGPPYFQQVAGPLLGAVVLLMGIGPLLPWRRASRDHLVRSFSAPVAATVGIVAVLAVVGVRNPVALLGFGLCAFVLSTVVQEFVKGVAARQRSQGESVVVALGQLVRRNNRRYGGYLVHLSMILIGAGVVGSTMYQQESLATLRPGETMQVGSYSLTLLGLDTIDIPGARVVEAPIRLGSEVLRPEKVFFKSFEKQPNTKVAIRSTPMEDLYVVLSDWQGSGPSARVSVLAFVNPLVSWIWTGGLVFLAGSLVVLWPMQRTVPHTAEAPVQQGMAGAPA